MDTVGMGQLGMTDHEACFARDRYDPRGFSDFLFHTAAYVLAQGPVIKDGDVITGPGRVDWQARRFAQGKAPPPRAVCRWLPLDGSEPPAELLAEPG
jgi:hypothetical protein